MRPDPRLYLDAPLSAGAKIALEKDQAHYLINVMRKKAGEGVRVFNGMDGEWAAQIIEAGRRNAIIELKDQTRQQVSPPDLTLYFAPVKKARTDFIIEKATELGARSIVPVITARTIADRVKTERMHALAREAAEQTERLDLPQIGEPVVLTALLNQFEADRGLIFCDEAGDDGGKPWGGQTGRANDIASALTNAPKCDKWAIIIGPEGGFATGERQLVRSHTHVVPVSLGPRILRADTAVVAAMSVFQAIKGDWT